MTTEVVRARLAQAFGRLIRRADDRGRFVLLSAATPSRLLDAFPPACRFAASRSTKRWPRSRAAFPQRARSGITRPRRAAGRRREEAHHLSPRQVRLGRARAARFRSPAQRQGPPRRRHDGPAHAPGGTCVRLCDRLARRARGRDARRDVRRLWPARCRPAGIGASISRRRRSCSRSSTTRPTTPRACCSSGIIRGLRNWC